MSSTGRPPPDRFAGAFTPGAHSLLDKVARLSQATQQVIPIARPRLFRSLETILVPGVQQQAARHSRQYVSHKLLGQHRNELLIRSLQVTGIGE